MDSVKEIHDIAKSNEMKKNYLNYLRKISKGLPKVYYAHPVFERNSIGSNLYKYFCYLKLKDNLVSFNNFAYFDIKSFEFFMFKFSKLVFITYLSISGFIVFCKKSIYGLIYLLRIRKNLGKFKSTNSETIKYSIFTFVDKNTLEQDYFVDRYFPLICEKSGVNKSEVLLICVLSYDIKNKESLEKIKNYFPNTCCPEQFVCIRDYIKYFLSYFYLIIYCLFKITFTFRKNFIDCLFIKELFKFTPNPSCFGDVVLGSLKKKYNISNLVTFINSFENLEYEKRFNYALKKYFPNCLRIGFQHATLIDTQLSNYPIQEEVTCNMLPDVILANGNKYKQVFVEYFKEFNNVNIIIKASPTLRYKKFCDASNMKNIIPSEYCLIIATIEARFTIDSVILIVKALQKKQESLKIIVRVHPMLPTEELKNYFWQYQKDLSLLNSIEWLEADNNFFNLIYYAKYIFTCSTGSVLDILSVGRTPVILAFSSVQLLMIPQIDEKFFNFIKVIYNESDLESLFNSSFAENMYFEIKKWYLEFYKDEKNLFPYFFSI